MFLSKDEISPLPSSKILALELFRRVLKLNFIGVKATLSNLNKSLKVEKLLNY